MLIIVLLLVSTQPVPFAESLITTPSVIIEPANTFDISPHAKELAVAWRETIHVYDLEILKKYARW